MDTTLELHCRRRRHLYDYHHEQGQNQGEYALGVVVQLLTFHQHGVISVLLVFANH